MMELLLNAGIIEVPNPYVCEWMRAYHFCCSLVCESASSVQWFIFSDRVHLGWSPPSSTVAKPQTFESEFNPSVRTMNSFNVFSSSARGIFFIPPINPRCVVDGFLFCDCPIELDDSTKNKMSAAVPHFPSLFQKSELRCLLYRRGHV